MNCVHLVIVAKSLGQIRVLIFACFQMFSKPLLVLSIATAFSEEAESSDRPSGGTHESNASSDVPPEIAPVQTTLETR